MKNQLETELELDAFEVTVTKNPAQKAFVHCFHFKSGHVSQKNLGDVFGVIQVFDHSQQSAYLPNLIAQVIKKEYYSKPERDPEKSFEAALHKANLALADLAQHEIVGWIDKIHAVIGVMQKDNFHFTQTGGGRILLVRNKLINDLTRGMLGDGEDAPHPIKTFSNISSGKIEVKDKIIFATETVFEVVKWEELKRHCNTFNSNEFDNIFRSTLELESNQAGAIVINIDRRNIFPAEEKTAETAEDLNFFGDHLNETESSSKEKAASIADENVAIETKAADSRPDNFAETEKPLEAEDNTGFIEAENNEPSPKENPIDATAKIEHEDKFELFIKEEAIPEESFPSIDRKKILKTKLEMIKEDALLWLSGRSACLKKRLSRLDKKTRNKLPVFAEKLKTAIKKSVPEKIHLPNLKEKISLQKNILKTQNLGNALKNVEFKNISNKISLKKTAVAPCASKFKHFCRGSWQKILEKHSTLIKSLASLKNQPEKKLSEKHIPSSPALRHRLLPFVVAAALLIILLIVLPFLFSKKKQPDIAEEASKEISTETTDLSGSEEIKNLTEMASGSFSGSVRDMALMRGELFMIDQNGSFYRYTLNNGQFSKIELPAGNDHFDKIAPMPSLGLIFLINKDKVLSFSPVVNKFEENRISMPKGYTSIGEDTYLTYLYLLDKTSNQLYQYPRANGGFGAQKQRLKAETDLSLANDMAIDDAVFIAFADGRIEKYFKGEKQSDFSFEKPEEKFVPSKIKTESEESDLFILDSANGKMLIVAKNAQLKKSYAHANLIGAKDFWPDTKSKTVYIVDGENKIKKFTFEN